MRNLIIIIICSFGLLTCLALLFFGSATAGQSHGLLIACGVSVVVLGVVGLLIIGRFYQLGSRAKEEVSNHEAQGLPGSKRFATQSASAALKANPPSTGATFGASQSIAAPARHTMQPGSGVRKEKDDFEMLAKSLAAANKSRNEEKENAAGGGPSVSAQERFNIPIRQGEQSSLVPPMADILVSGEGRNEMFERLQIRKSEITALIEKSKRHLGTVDDYMMKHLSKNTTGSIQAVVDIRRILSALEKRLAEINAVIVQPTITDVEHATYLINGDLIIEADSLNTLMSQEPMPPLKPAEWSVVLGQLFVRVSRRRSIFKGLKFSRSGKNT
jgi:hypothetical protein